MAPRGWRRRRWVLSSRCEVGGGGGRADLAGQAGGEKENAGEEAAEETEALESWPVGGNKKVLKAAGLFAGSIFLMRNFGDLMAI
ncbi:hypothetical protein U9M48_009895 [Paspalum notatum var. saurae]|uniref:Uncharacterized protein n=1 Tax=Paspalum notatum var. saurae TaxID=547442 RepID=A0AAQ3SS67_PASNO